ncbi:hypothetical protein DAI22_02g265200 [Oryza sativa Japonica Group]|nr:hypothetical protein DAI22_02g265200 [Oryza sativa Japonica Group]
MAGPPGLTCSLDRSEDSSSKFTILLLLRVRVKRLKTPPRIVDSWYRGSPSSPCARGLRVASRIHISCSARSRHSGDHLTSSRHVAAGWISHARLTNSSREAGHRSPGAIRSPGEVELRSLEWRCRPAWSRR